MRGGGGGGCKELFGKLNEKDDVSGVVELGDVLDSE